MSWQEWVKHFSFVFLRFFLWWPYIHSHVALVDLSLYTTLKRCFLSLSSPLAKEMLTLLHGLTNPSSLSSLVYICHVYILVSRFSLPINYFISQVFIDKSDTSFFISHCKHIMLFISSLFPGELYALLRAQKNKKI